MLKEMMHSLYYARCMSIWKLYNDSLIINGTKIIKIRRSRYNFIDSLNFFNVGLAKLFSSNVFSWNWKKSLKFGRMRSFGTFVCGVVAGIAARGVFQYCMRNVVNQLIKRCCRQQRRANWPNRYINNRNIRINRRVYLNRNNANRENNRNENNNLGRHRDYMNRNKEINRKIVWIWDLMLHHHLAKRWQISPWFQYTWKYGIYWTYSWFFAIQLKHHGVVNI